ncbi:MAG: SpoIIE family protein phosphatase [Chlamydiales bacterium]
MIPFRKTIGFRLLALSFLLLALPLLVDSFVLLVNKYESIQAESENYLIESAYLRVLPLSKLQPIRGEVFEALIYFLGLENNFPQQESEQLNKELVEIAEVGALYNVMLLNISPEGAYKVVSSAKSEYLGRDYTEFFQDPDPFHASIQDWGYVEYISYNEKTMHPYFVAARGILSKEGKNLGIIAVINDASDRLQQLLSIDSTNYPVRFALMLPSMIVLAATDPTLLFQYFSPLDKARRHLFLTEEEVYSSFLAPNPIEIHHKLNAPYMEFEWQGEKQYGVIQSIANTNFELLAYASERELKSYGVQDFFGIYVSYALILVIGGCVVLLLTRILMRPIQHLGVVMHQIEEGDLSARFRPRRFGFQINKLGLMFNEMLDAFLDNQALAENERVARETLAQELRVGKKVQETLLAKHIEDIGPVELVEQYLPAIEVGGDFYDFYRKESGKLVLAVADASGKGVQACCYSLILRNMLRTYASESDDVADVMRRSNNLFCKDTGDTGMFVTVQMAQYDYDTRELSYYSFGHNPGIIVRKGGALELLDRGDIAMGVIEKTERLQTQTKRLELGDVVVFYTDGVTEAHNIEKQLFGEDRLMQLLQSVHEKSAAEILALIEEAVHQFVGKAPQHDDITLLIMKVMS